MVRKAPRDRCACCRARRSRPSWRSAVRQRWWQPPRILPLPGSCRSCCWCDGSASTGTMTWWAWSWPAQPRTSSRWPQAWWTAWASATTPSRRSSPGVSRRSRAWVWPSAPRWTRSSGSRASVTWPQRVSAPTGATGLAVSAWVEASRSIRFSAQWSPWSRGCRPRAPSWRWPRPTMWRCPSRPRYTRSSLRGWQRRMRSGR